MGTPGEDETGFEGDDDLDALRGGPVPVSELGPEAKAAAALEEALDDLRRGDLHPGKVAARLTERIGSLAGEDGASSATEDLAARWTALPADTFTTTPPKREWLLERRSQGGSATDGVFPRGKLGILGGAGGVGKTSALCRLAIAAAIGSPWLDAEGSATEGWYVPPEQAGRVLLALAEEDRDEIVRRLHNAGRAMKLTEAQQQLVIARVVPLALMGCPAPLLDDNLERTAAFDFLQKQLTESTEPWSLIIADPLVRFAARDAESDQVVATRLLQAFESWTDAPGGPSVLVAHHTSQVSRNATSSDTTDVRGVTALTDNARWVALLRSVEIDGVRRVEFKHTKSNYSKLAPTQILNYDEATHGTLRLETAAERLERQERAREILAAEEAKPKRSNGRRKSAPVDPLDAYQDPE